MGSDDSDHHHPVYEETKSKPKLLFSSLKSKAVDSTGMLTPPLQTPVSIPFQWEVAPGMPRSIASAAGVTHTSSKASRCLVLPPRLLAETSKVTNMSSPVTVLDGPYEVHQGRSLSRTLSFSSGKGSWRWGSFRKETGGAVSDRGSFDFSSSFTDGAENVPKEKKVGRRIRRKGSFLSFSPGSSKLLESIYGSFKQAVPWKRRHENLRRMSM